MKEPSTSSAVMLRSALGSRRGCPSSGSCGRRKPRCRTARPARRARTRRLLLHALRVDALHALDGGQRGDAVSKASGPLEFQRLGGFLHLRPHPVLHGIRLAGQEGAGGIRHGSVILRADLPGAGARATLDLEQQAGPRPVLVIAVGAGAQEEGPLQGVHGAVHRPDAGEGAIVIPLPPPRAAMLHDLRRGPVIRHEDVGKDLSSRISTLKRGFNCLIRLASRSSASVSVAVVTNSIAAVCEIIRAMRFECAWPRA